MVSIEQSFDMFDRHIKLERDDCRYPPPPQALFGAPVDMGLAPEPFTPFTNAQEPFSGGIAYDPAPLYAEAPSYGYNGRSSPAGLGEERAGSSNLSTASAPSAASSAVGSPQSNHGQIAPIPEWAAAQALNISPNIVGHTDYFLTGNEYGAFGPGAEEYAPFDFGSSKGPGFVGELSNVSTCNPKRPRVPSFPLSLGIQNEPGVAVQSAQLAAEREVTPTSSPLSVSSSDFDGLVPFLSPATTAASFPSPLLASASEWDSSQGTSRGFSKGFFSHSSGNFVAPLQSSYPSLIHPDISRPMPIPFDAPFQSNTAYPASPALSHAASSPRPMMRNGSQSPFLHNGFQPPFSPYQTALDATAPRRPSHPFASPGAYPDAAAAFSGDESKEKSRCPHPDCGKSFKDLKAHMLTHQTERPEKCPIATCEYHVKGFSRKYDRNRHTLTHYKGTMVCGFCPGSGSAAEKSFNRADVFKRHLTAVHGVEQTPPNSRKKTPASTGGGKRLTTGYPSDATGKCSTCSQTFANAQDFYEHLDECVLRIVQQEDPAEAVNARNLAGVENDSDVIRTLEKNNLPATTTVADTLGAEGDAGEDDEDMVDDDDEDDDDERPPRILTTRKKTGPVNGVQKSKGMTHSRGGVTLRTRRGRKHRRDYPPSWGFDKGQMTMKKRVMAVFEGPRRLAKDDMMLSTEHEVRVSLGDGKSYVTDLDVQTMKRAEGFLGATEAEKGPWVSDDPTEEELRQMREMLEVGEAEA